MSEPKSSGWLQRLVGADPKAIAALEEQLNKAKHDAQQLGAELAREREELTQERQKLTLSEARARAAEEDFEARLVAVGEAQQQKLDAAEELDRKHKQAMGELLTTRTAHKRLTEEKEKLAQALAATKTQTSQGETALQAAKSQLADLEKQLADARTEANLARDQAREQQRVAEGNGNDSAEAKRKLQALETRSSTLERELAQARQAEEGAESGVATLRTELAGAEASAASVRTELTAAQSDVASLRQELAEAKSGAASSRTELADAQASVASLRTQLTGVQSRRERALSMAQDLWRALQGVVGDGAALALVMGVETGTVAVSRDLVEASAALKRAFESKALCQGLKVESLADGIRIELRGAELSDSAVTAPWLVASVTRFLEKAAGLELAIDSSSVERDTLTLRLSQAATRAAS